MENAVGVLIEPLSWELMAIKAGNRKTGVTLDRIHTHSQVEVLALPGDAEQARMLEQLGVRVGAGGYVRSAAPLGGPILLEIGGSAVAIARGVAKKIRVRVV